MTPGSSQLLRSALEAAMVVAREEEQADPTRPAPPALRPYLRFARLPGPALEVARRVLDGDPEFRQRVAAATTEAQIGRPAWLWLNRPEGWEADLEQLRKDALDLETTAREERAERDARRRLTRAEDTARRAEAALALHSRDLEHIRAELAHERAGRTQAEAELADLRSHLSTLRDERNRAVRSMKEAEGELANRSADLRHARHQLRLAEAQLEQAKHQTSAAAPVAPPPAANRSEPMATAAPRTAAAIDAASQAARALADALAEAASALSAETSVGRGPDAGAALAKTRPPVPPGARRTVPRPPPGILDDSVAAAQHLVGLSGVVLLVDGYNIAKTAWPTATLPDQRQRLIDALAELHARTAATVEVVFDGTDGADPRPVVSKQAVQVRFSPGGVAADDVVLAMIDDVPVHRPVVVASSDNAVRDGARSRGAAVLSARQMVAALRR